MDIHLFPRRFPRTPDPDLQLRIARIRIQVALLAVKEALNGETVREDSVELALENLDLARSALLRG